jgi:hypothetical protein
MQLKKAMLIYIHIYIHILKIDIICNYKFLILWMAF